MTQLIKFEEMGNMAQAFYKSGLFKDLTSEAQAIVKMQAGQELGVPPMASMNGVHIVKGKTVLSATLMASLIKRSGKYTYKQLELTDQVCKLEFLENSTALGISSFSLDDASKAGLLGNPTWKSYPRNMLFARALSNGARWFCADIFAGPVYVEGELDEPIIPIDTKLAAALEVRSEQPVDVMATVIEPASTVDELLKIQATDEQVAVIRKTLSECKSRAEVDEVAQTFKDCYDFTPEQLKMLGSFKKLAYQKVGAL